MSSHKSSSDPKYKRALATLSEKQSWALARRLADGQLDCCNDLMADLGSPPPVMIWNPQPADMEANVLRVLDDWWRHAVEAAGGPPTPQMVDPLILRSALGAISLLDVVDGGRDFQMRLHGSEIAETLGVDMTGMNLGEMAVPFMAFLMVTYRAQLLRPEPLLLRYTPAMQFFLSAWWRIGMPLMRDGKVVRLLIGMVRTERQPFA